MEAMGNEHDEARLKRSRRKGREAKGSRREYGGTRFRRGNNDASLGPKTTGFMYMRTVSNDF